MVYNNITTFMSANGWAYLTATLFVLFLLCVAGYIFLNTVKYRKISFFIGVILVLGIGINYGIPGGSIDLGFTKLSALAVAALVGIILNAILPGKDYEFGTNFLGDTSVNFDANTNRVKE